jgi:hypothetical protein
MNEYVFAPVAGAVGRMANNPIRDWMRRRFGKTQDLLSGTVLLENFVDPVASPWLRWIRGKLGGRSIDVVHFMTDSTFYLDRGGLMVDAEDQIGANPHLVTATELLNFQAQIGAWGTGFSSAKDNFSDLAMRQFADELARLRPGPLFYHDVAADSDGTALKQAYSFMFSDKPSRPPNSPAVFMYCEPFRVVEESNPNATFASSSAGYFGIDTIEAEDQVVRNVFQHFENAPPWLASSERFVEFYKKRLVELSNKGPEASGEIKEIRSALTRMQSAIVKNII